MTETELEAMCDAGRSFHARGLAFGSTGNLSVREGDTVWITPTGQSMRHSSVESLAALGMDGSAQNANKPSKEYPFHLQAYAAAGGRAAALVHLHCTWSVMLSCLDDLDEAAPLPVMTPYYLMRVAPLAVVPYFRPGSADLAAAIGTAAAGHDCLLLRNHGIVCLGRTVSEAVDRAEELEETAKLFFQLRNEKVRLLTAEQQNDIGKVFGGR
ncbi:MAG: aldolase [Acidobacteria bacterium]|nr:aldolase [Acidobacteriota bacterium]